MRGITRRIPSIGLAGVMSLSVALAAGSAVAQTPQQGVDASASDSAGFDAAKGPLLNCGQLQWLDDRECRRVNRVRHKAPSAPLRIRDKNGLEHNFAPDTPRALIRLTIEQTPEAAAAYYQYMERVMDTNNRIQKLIQAEARRRGDPVIDGPPGNLAARTDSAPTEALPTGATGSVDAPPPGSVDAEDLRIYVFSHSRCAACEPQYEHLEELGSRYPDLAIQVLQLNPDQRKINALRQEYDFKVNIIPAADRERYTQLITTTPTVWVDNVATSDRVIRDGVQPARTLEAIMSKVN